MAAAVLSVVVGGAAAAKAFLPVFNPTYVLEASQVSSGTLHTCAIDDLGGAVCWGSNHSGELGDGNAGRNATMPVRVPGLNSNVTDISAGWWHTCAVQSGTVKCWGNNSSGQLGDGTTTDSTVPVVVQGLDAAAASVKVGTTHTCALTVAGGVFCWGLNGYPETWKIPCCILGDGTNEPLRLTPTPVVGLSYGVAAISVSDYHSCALTVAGLVGCWGTHSHPRIPMQIDGLPTNIVSISAGGATTCAVTAAGAALCWGDNSYGQIGDGSSNSADRPRTVLGFDAGAAAISVGGLGACALTTGNSARCWGQAGTLGNGTESASLVPVPVLGGKFEAISVGGFHTCGIVVKLAAALPTRTERQPGAKASVVECWGDNSAGELGNGTTQAALKPTPVMVPY